MALGDLKTFSYYPYLAGLGTYNNSTDTFKLALVTEAYSAVNADLANPALTSFTEVTAGGNYTVGGNALPGNAWAINAGVTSLDFTDFSMLKDAGNPTNAKTAIIINSTAGGDAYHAIDLTSDGGTTAPDLVNNDLNIAFNANGTFTVTVS